MLLEESSRRILILDGAMGTMLQKYKLEEDDFRGEAFAACTKELKGNNECLNLTHPELLLDIHRQYIAAGADIISTNSFSANRICQAAYGLEERACEMACAAAAIARRAADEALAENGRKVWVAGDIGPTGKSLSLASDISDPAYRQYDFDAMAQSYKEQISALVKGGVDLLLIETCFDALNVKACLWAIADLGLNLPVMISVSVGDRSGRTLTGQTIEAFYRSVEHAGLFSFGLNCSLGADELEPLVEDVALFSKCRVSCHPNAGLPDALGNYNDSPEHMAKALARMASAGLLNIAGGCCGTTPEHIKAIAAALEGIAPRALPKADNILTVSGLEAVKIDPENNFTNIGERTNVAGSRKFARLIAAHEYETALQVAADQIAGGADIIDINMDDAMLDSREEMKRFLRHISNDPAVARAAIMIDSSHFETIVEGLKNAQGKCIVNSISLKEGEEAMLEKARSIRALGAAMVVMAFDEEGQATDYERKISICQRAYKLLTKKAGVPPQDIIFDVNVLSVGTGLAEHRRYGIDFIEAVRWIKTNLKGALTSGGISNLSFAFRGNNPVREAMHSAFLYHAGAAGLDMGIVNPGMLQIYDEIDKEMLEAVEDVILDRREDATERLIAKAQEALAIAKNGNEAATEENTAAAGTAEERIVSALVRGQAGKLKDDLMECLGQYGTAVNVIEGPLMDGMKRVGEYFGEGKMFLPQVVKSARIMRDAVDLLRPYMGENGESRTQARPRIVIATVKGDVHDIGKNITAIVLNCNGFEVIDLGVMVPKEKILDTALECGAQMIAVSGLITPSLFQMEELCREMSARGLSLPLFIGGATTSAVHTAVKLVPLYGHVFYGSDASASAVMCKSYMADTEAFEAAEHAKQEKLRELYLSAEAEKKKKLEEQESGDQFSRGYPEESYIQGCPFKDIPVRELGIDEVMEYFDWRMLFAVWGVKEDAKLRKDAEHLIARLRAEGSLSIRLALHFEEAYTDAEDRMVLSSGAILPMMRQDSGERLSIADYLPKEEYGFKSALGLFAVAVHGKESGGCDCPACSSDYASMLLRSVRVTLAEAASSWVDEVLKAQLPEGSGARIVKPAAGYYSCPDHTMKRDMLALIPDSEKLGISFTESFAMVPDASICAFVFAHPSAAYPEIRRVNERTVEDYARKRGFDKEQTRTFLSHLLA
ncbi:MAG: methionine synthase [Bacteroidales bacterium]|nr:methionine synthase [Bacteroidales bacterium]